MDYIIRNSKVFDSISGSFAEKNLYVKDGYIAETEKTLVKATVIDAKGKYVLPGLIDEHAHLYLDGTMIGANADTTCLPCGITTANDGGTAGASGFEMFYKADIIRYETSVYAFLNVSTFGNKSLCKHEENHDPEDFREDLIVKLFEKFPHVLRGLKVRMCKETLEGYGMAPLYWAINLSEKMKKKGFNIPVAVHYGNLPENVSVDELAGALRKGDILSHIYQTHGETIFDEKGKVKTSVKEAKKRGVWIDSCNGRVHWSFENLKKAFEEEFYPDIISSDLVRASEYNRPGFSLIHAMSVFSAAGMQLEKILKATTYSPAQALGILDRAGTLEVGKPADIAIFDIQDTDMIFDDMFGKHCKGNKLFVPLLTMKQGRVAYRQIFF
ncbi:amidohydrolase family protein [uncultured Blautia sp.]|uniref:amidohydrolase family protein n=1 Tax=Blautia parvula TaxID=2877527 RepID=UPI0025977DDB|nr:amidohydrolase family protein [uncultured Blautia sp.]